METISLKALSVRRLHGNIQGNSRETVTKSRETLKETGGAPALPIPPAVQLPEPRAWLTDKGDFMSSGSFPGDFPHGGIAPEIVKLTAGNLPLQKILLQRHLEYYDRHHIGHLLEQYEERAAIMQYDGGMSREQAEQAAAERYHLQSFLPRGSYEPESA